MTYAGARGDTEQQMGKVLHLGNEQKTLHAAFGALQRGLAKAGEQKGIQLSIANALWAQKDHPFLPAFLQTAKGDYQASVAQADFKAAAEPARGEINHWVAQKTRNRIQDILPDGSVNHLTRLVLANAIYFKGTWARRFDKSATSTAPFDLAPGRKVEVPMMRQKGDVRYTENADFQAVELPYIGGGLSMVILLPNQADGCGQLERRLTPALLASTLKQMREQEVEIFLPRFKLESSFKLNDTLASMGLTAAFGTQADFSGMDGTKDLFISGVFHKAWGEVNEEGTEAAAATAVVMATKALVQSPAFLADHPFIFFIRDTRSGSLLFLGRLADPSH